MSRGEGTALVESMEGKSGRPRMKPPFIKQCGLFHLPTCVNNVKKASVWFPAFCWMTKTNTKPTAPPTLWETKMISVAGNVKKPGAFEIPFGITVREIIYDLAGGVTDGNEIQLIQFGGASGKIASADILDTPYTYEDLSAAGVGVGSGAILVVDQRTSVLDFLRITQDFFSHESCGQCTPCREGNTSDETNAGKNL